MVFYQQLIVTIPKTPKEELTKLFRKHTKLLMELGGNVRGIENHGVRALPEVAKRRYISSDGSRYYWEARFVTSHFDASPKALSEITRMLRNEESVLRFFTVKKETTADRIASKSYKNPHLNVEL